MSRVFAQDFCAWAVHLVRISTREPCTCSGFSYASRAGILEPFRFLLHKASAVSRESAQHTPHEGEIQYARGMKNFSFRMKILAGEQKPGRGRTLIRQRPGFCSPWKIRMNRLRLPSQLANSAVRTSQFAACGCSCPTSGVGHSPSGSDKQCGSV